MKWETNPPRLMKTGIKEIHARKWPNWSPFWYRTWVSVTALCGAIEMGREFWVLGYVDEILNRWKLRNGVGTDLGFEGFDF